MFELMVFLVGVITALSQVMKGLGLKKKYIPVANIALGTLLGVFFLPLSVKENVLFGVVVGLSASGLFDLSKIMKK